MYTCVCFISITHGLCPQTMHVNHSIINCKSLLVTPLWLVSHGWRYRYVYGRSYTCTYGRSKDFPKYLYGMAHTHMGQPVCIWAAHIHIWATRMCMHGTAYSYTIAKGEIIARNKRPYCTIINTYSIGTWNIWGTIDYMHKSGHK